MPPFEIMRWLLLLSPGPRLTRVCMQTYTTPHGTPLLAYFVRVGLPAMVMHARPAAPAVACGHRLGPTDAAVAPCGRYGRARAPPRPPTPKVRGEAWAAVSPTGVGTYLNV